MPSKKPLVIVTRKLPAVIETRTPIVFLDWTLLPGASVEIPLAASHQA